MFDLKGKTVLISGIQGNLGPIWKSTLLKAGAAVYGFDIGIEQSTLSERKIDITQEQELIDYFRWWQQNNICPDIIINNAAIDNPPGEGVNFWSSLAEIINTNLIGAGHLVALFIDEMKKKGGTIINIGSIQGNVAADWRNYEGAFEKPVGYNLSKAAYIQFTRSLAVQYGKFNIRSVCLAFSAVDTGKFEEPFKSKFLKCLPLGRFISLDSLRMSLLYACCCPELTGQQVLIDSGYTAW